MENKNTIKIVISILIFLVFGGLTALAMLVDLNLGITETSSIEGVIAKKEKLIELEEKLDAAEMEYATKKNELITVKANFEKAKAKYEAISDKTVELIREATTEENYDIEYMWIKLGNYALVNNLSIVMVEPGGTNTTTTATTNTSSDNSSGTNGTADASTTANGTTTASTTEQGTTTSVDGTNQASNSQTVTTNTADSILTVTVEGSYLNMADFVFEVENDKELRFKLDNIEIVCVTGTTIRAKFNVKNVIVLK